MYFFVLKSDNMFSQNKISNYKPLQLTNVILYIIIYILKLGLDCIELTSIIN